MECWNEDGRQKLAGKRVAGCGKSVFGKGGGESDDVDLFEDVRVEIMLSIEKELGIRVESSG